VLEDSQILMTQIYVKVEPSSPEFKIEEGDIPKIYLEQEAENSKANQELVRRLQKILGEKPGIVSGHKSRRKKLKLNLPEEEIRSKLEDYNG